MKYPTLLFSLLSLLCLTSCVELQPISCDLMLVSVGVEVTGAELTRTYTIDSQNDTLRFEMIRDANSIYIIADDLDKDKINEDGEDFSFHGYVNDSLVIVEPYRLASDECHILKVSGRERIAL